MKKILKCVECSIGCELIVDLTENGEDHFRMKCGYGTQYWRDVTALRKSEEEQKLPKLTVEVFDRPDCPEWARYAVINSKGRLSFFLDKPKFEGEDYGCWSCNGYGYIHINNAFFDASDWENSLVERPAKALPNWCKVGAWVYYIPFNKYCKIEQMSDGFMLRFVDGDSTAIPFKDINTLAEVKQRPFNEKEMLDLVGKVLSSPSGEWRSLIVRASGDTVTTFYRDYNADTLMSDGYLIDGKPCYKLEYRNKTGEWVE